MKLFIVALLVAAVAAKSEIKVKNTCSNPLVHVDHVDDEKSGAVTINSVLLLDFDTRTDTWAHDPFKHVNEIKIYKWLFVKYIQVPNALVGMVCKKAQGLYPGKINCKGSGQHGGYLVEVDCFMKELTGHCYPKVGKSHFRFPIKPEMELIKQSMNGIFAGWVKASLVTKSQALGDQIDFCVEAEAKIDL